MSGLAISRYRRNCTLNLAFSSTGKFAEKISGRPRETGELRQVENRPTLELSVFCSPIFRSRSNKKIYRQSGCSGSVCR
ncbi:hypothetical protein CKA32_006113 [Geitlerinema sp. FC II]|nr:hypothetical protein CKA32_006113 [Geitlerinema sp. FC II]